MIAASSCILGLLHGIGRQVVGESLGRSCFHKADRDVIALAVNGWINLVCDITVALVLLKADVVRARAYPHILAIHLERCFPQTKMMPACHNRVRLGLFVAEVLYSPEKIQLA